VAYIIDDIINAIGSAQAAQKQEQAARDAMGVQQGVYNQSRADQQPWMQAGQQSLGSLLQMTNGGYDLSQLANDPGYQFRMQQGQQALERSAAARGGLNSGGFMKGLARYSQGVASDEFGNRFNRLSSIAGMGQNSAQNLGQLGRGYADSMGNLYGALGNAQSAGIMGITNGISGGIRSLGNLGMTAATGGFSNLGSLAGMGGGGGGGGGPSASGAYAANPGGYNLGSYNLLPTQRGGY
jgi:hypothetical protein